MSRNGVYCFVLAVLAALPSAAFAGGAWVPAPGQGDVQLGFSQKTANTSWDSSGNAFHNLTTFEGERVSHYHDFRYAYLSGEVGLLRNLSATWTVTYLDGLEGPRQDLERNSGLSDAWFGLKYGVRQGDWPVALAFIYRTPYFYDLDGPYSRYLYDAQGNIRDESPEWRGVLKHDYTFSVVASHSFLDGRGWANLQTGYTWREGAPADEIPVWADVGYPLPFWGAAAKLAVVYVGSRGNDSPRRPDDRFGSSATFNFNDASMARAGAGFLVPLGRTGATLEAGYNQWIWGKSARRYDEPYLSLGYRF
jgi:hypothetical protein